MSNKSVKYILGFVIILALGALFVPAFLLKQNKGVKNTVPTPSSIEKTVSPTSEPITSANIEGNLEKTSDQIQKEIDQADSDLKDIDKTGIEDDLSGI